MTELAGGLSPYVPRVASSWDVHAPGSQWRTIEGSLVFVDISGFTNLSERLARRGRIGAEELTAVLDRVFGRMLEIVSSRGGSLLKFGGDALLLLFDTEDHVMQACAATVEMRKALRTASEERTSVGRINLRMSSGIHTGAIDFFLVGRSHRELIVSGPTASITTAMEAIAEAGEIVVSEDVRKALPSGFIGSPKEDGWLLAKRRINHPPIDADSGVLGDDVDIADFVPGSLREHLRSNIAGSEHRIATVGFVKFSGVDALLATGDSARVAKELDRLISAVQMSVAAEGVTFLATDIDADGGKIILASGVPVSQHDDEGRLLRAVRAILDVELDLSLRIGVNRGHVFSGDVGTHFRRTYTVMGDSVNLAARLMATANPGELYATPAVLSFSSSLFRADALKAFRVKGKEQPVQAFSVGQETGVRPPVLDSDLPFKGRDADMQMLVGIVNTCSRVGRGGIMTITGDTGVGKTRLISEVLDACTGIDTLMIQAEPAGIDNPYWAFRDPMRRLLGIERGTQEEMTQSLTAAIETSSQGLSWALPLLGNIMHIEIPDNAKTGAIDPRFRPDRTADVLIDLLSGGGKRPVALVAEDGQWLDEASQTLLARIGEAASVRPWTVIVTARNDQSAFELMGDEIALQPLDDEAIRAIAVEVTQATPLRPHELDAVVAKADGNPLFLNEILRLVSETGTAEQLPENLDAVVSTEIDSLAPLPRQLLRYASVLGRRFRRVVLDEFLAPEEVHLDEATEQDLLRFIEEEEGGRLAFRHSVVHEIAYGSLSYSKRRELHARAGHVIERRAGNDPDSVAGYLATHYSQSGEYAKAWRYAQIAAQKARDAYANSEATAHLRRALECARYLDDVDKRDVAEVWTSLGQIHDLTGGYEEAREAYNRAIRIDREDPARNADRYLRRAEAWFGSGNLREAKKNLTLGRKEAKRATGLPARRSLSRLVAYEASVHAANGDPANAIQAANRAIALAKGVDEAEALARAYGVRDWANFVMGIGPPQHGEEAIMIFEDLGMLERSVGVKNNLGIMSYLQGDWDSAVDWYRQSVETAERSGNALEAANTRANIAEVLIGQRKFEEAFSLLESADRTFRASKAPAVIPFVKMLEGLALIGVGDADRAVEVLEPLAEEQLSGSTTSWTAETLIGLGQALVESDRSADAIAWMDRLESDLPDEAVRLSPGLSRVRALADAARGDYEQATALIQKGMTVAVERDEPFEEALLLETMVQVNSRVGMETDPASESRLNELLERFGVVAPQPV